MSLCWGRAVIAATVVLLGPAAATEACQCVVVPDTCRRLTASDAVLEGTVDAIRVLAGADRLTITLNGTLQVFTSDLLVITLRDVRGWRGAVTTFVTTTPEPSSCGYTFEVGKRYLIAGNAGPDGRVRVDRCGLTRPISEARTLIDYIQSAADTGARPPVRVWGRVVRASRWIDFSRDYVGIPGARVELRGTIWRDVETADDGSYVMTELPPGKYRATVRPPASLAVLESPRSLEFEIGVTPDTACAEVDLVMPISSAISGLVTDESGRPLRDVFVVLWLPDQTDLTRGHAGSGDDTDARGRYEFTGMPPGRYTIGLYQNDRPDELATATIVTLGFGERLVLKPMVIRKRSVDRR
jgi:hypothetical protein